MYSHGNAAPSASPRLSSPTSLQRSASPMTRSPARNPGTGTVDAEAGTTDDAMNTFLQVLYSDDLNEVVEQWGRLLGLDPAGAREDLQRRLAQPRIAERGPSQLAQRQGRGEIPLASERARRGQPDDPHADSRMIFRVHDEARRAIADKPPGGLALDPADALAREPGIDVVPVEQLRDSRGAGRLVRRKVSLTTDRVIARTITIIAPAKLYLLPARVRPPPHQRRQRRSLTGSQTDRTPPHLERLCDAIAAEILLPASTITRAPAAGNAPVPGHRRQSRLPAARATKYGAIALRGSSSPSRRRGAHPGRRTATVLGLRSQQRGRPPRPSPVVWRGGAGSSTDSRHRGQRWSGWTTSDFGFSFAERPERPTIS